ncbi:hypothetical protein YC2023_026602 [Brassica napus]
MGLSFHLAVQQEESRSRRRRLTRKAIQDSETCVAREITQDLLIEILARLPAKSVLRLKCLSKFWSSLFCSRYFCDRFLMVPSRPQPRLFMSLIDWDCHSKSLLLSAAPTTSCLSSFVFDDGLTIRKMGGVFMSILRGFICFSIHSRAHIYNPSTRQIVILPVVKSKILAPEESYSNMYNFLGHDPVNDQYKVLSIITSYSSKDLQNMRSEFWVFVIEPGGSWKRVAKDFHPHNYAEVELNTNGVLYYLAWTDTHTCVLVSFDMRSEEFDMIKVPRKPGDIGPSLRRRVTQIEYGGGKIAVFDFTYLKKTGTVDLWVVEDWGNKEWSRKTLVLQPSQMHLVTDNRLTPKGTTLKEKVFLIPEKLVSPYYFLCYDLRINDLRKYEIKGIPDHWFSKPEATKNFDMEFMDSNGSIKYFET